MLEQRVEEVLRERCRIDAARPLVVGVSGGADSLCLMDLLRRAGYPIIVAHFNHQLRSEADAEAKAVEEIAARFGLPFVVESGDVRLLARRRRLSLEEAARLLRYRFLFDQARRRNAQAVAVAHTADDQVETVLMHFLRGAGLSGLKGMLHRVCLPTFDPEIPLVRPLLDVWHDETVAYCASHDLAPIHDPSNISLDFLRNRLRHVLIPLLETYNPHFRRAAWRSAQALSADYALLNEVLDEWWKACVVREGVGYVMFDLGRLAASPIGVQRNLIRRAAAGLLPQCEVTFSTLERAARFISDEKRFCADLAGGLRLLREGDCLLITTAEANLPSDHWPQMPSGVDSIPLDLPGQATLSDGWHFSLTLWESPASAEELALGKADPFQVWLDADKLPQGLELRVRRPGDVFRPFGLGGHSQKLSDFFINVKLPRRARARWPLLCVGETVIWVPGYRVAEPFGLREIPRRAAHGVLRRRPERAET